MRRLPVASAVAGLAALVAVVTVVMTRHAPAYSYAGTSAAGRLALVAAGLSLVGAGLGSWRRRPGAWFGPLLVSGGFAWFVAEWNNPGVPSAAAFTAGLVLYASCPAFVGHALLVFPGGRRLLLAQHVIVASTYCATIVVLGLLPAFVFDPAASGCEECPRNLLLIGGHNSAADRLSRVGLWLSVVSLSALTLLLGFDQLRSSTAARRARRLVAAAGAIYLALVAALFASSLAHGALWQDHLQRRLWRAQAVTLIALALAVAWSWARARRRRAAVAQLVVELAPAPPPGGLRQALATIVGDPALELAYPREESELLVDLQGRPAHLSPEKEHTTLVGGGRTLAVVAHEAGAFGDEQLVGEVALAARLALENERLQAEVRARLEELRGSRARIVEAGDAERRRLEHDLHDGAQQRLVSLALALRLLRTQLPPETPPQTVERLTAADADLRAAIEELRELAHGIFPAVLADGGIGAAVSALAEEASVPVRLDALPDERYRAAVELAAFQLVAETVAVTTGSLLVRGARSDTRLLIEIDADGVNELPDRAELEDRVGAADGRVTVEQSDGTVRIVAEFPCAS